MANDSAPASAAPHSRLAARIQIAANLAVIVACVGVAWLVWMRATDTGPEPPPIYRVGEQIDAIDGVDFRAARQTLVMVLREDCRFCQESSPFYKKLTAAHATRADRTLRVVVASTDTPASLSTYLEARDIRVDQVASVLPGQLKVPGTPFLVLVDGNGTVTRLRRGRLAAPQEKEVLTVLGLAAPN